MKRMIVLIGICIAICCFCGCDLFKETYDDMSNAEKIEFFCELELPQEYEIESFSFEIDEYDGVIIYAEIVMSNEDLNTMIEDAGYVKDDYYHYKNEDVSWWDLKEEDIINFYYYLYSPNSETLKKTAQSNIYECDGKIYLECFG